MVWDQGQTTVREVYETLRERRQIAYTTVMTVMGNLVKKRLLAQDRSRTTFAYESAVPGREVVSAVLTSVVDRLLDGQTSVAVSQLLDLDEELSAEQADEVRAWVRQRFDI